MNVNHSAKATQCKNICRSRKQKMSRRQQGMYGGRTAPGDRSAWVHLGQTPSKSCGSLAHFGALQFCAVAFSSVFAHAAGVTRSAAATRTHQKSFNDVFLNAIMTCEYASDESGGKIKCLLSSSINSCSHRRGGCNNEKTST